MATLKAGTRMRSAVCKTEVMVIVAPATDVRLDCGGVPMIASSETPSVGGAPAADSSGGTLLGKRYLSAAGDLELLCVKPGDGSLAVDGAPMVLKEAKPLPSSD